MYARRFLGCIVVLTLLFVAGAFAFFEWGGRALVSQAVPKGHFQAPVTSGPDYEESSSWIARPDLPTDPSRWTPAGPEVATSGTAAASARNYSHAS